MTNQRLFNQNDIDKKSRPETSKFLSQLNLPPGVTFFLSKYQRIILISAVVFLITVVTIPLYNAWRDYRNSSAATALASAMQLDGEAMTVQLEHISEQYISTPAGLWATVTVAGITAEQGNLVDALAWLSPAKDTISANNPLKPLLITRMAKLNEELGNLEEAIVLYRKLVVFPGFVTDAYYSMGRVYTVMGKNSEAINHYQKYLDRIDKTGRGQSDSHRVMVEKNIKALR